MSDRVPVPSFYVSPEELNEAIQSLDKESAVRHILTNAMKKYETSIVEISEHVTFVDEKGGYLIKFHEDVVGSLKYYIYPTARFWRATFRNDVRIKQFNRADINKIKREVSAKLMAEANRRKALREKSSKAGIDDLL